MATKDVGKGWGDLPGSLTEWRCPKCEENYPVADWSIVWKEIGGFNCDGRKCPICDFEEYHNGGTMAMDTMIRTHGKPNIRRKTKKENGK